METIILVGFFPHFPPVTCTLTLTLHTLSRISVGIWGGMTPDLFFGFSFYNITHSGPNNFYVSSSERKLCFSSGSASEPLVSSPKPRGHEALCGLEQVWGPGARSGIFARCSGCCGIRKAERWFQSQQPTWGSPFKDFSSSCESHQINLYSLLLREVGFIFFHYKTLLTLRTQ